MKLAIAGPHLLQTDEAQAKQAQLLSERLPATLITYPSNPDSNADALTFESNPTNSLNRLRLYFFFKRSSKTFDRIILPGTINNSLFRVFPAKKCIPLISKRLLEETHEEKQAFLKLSQQFPLILVQSKHLITQLKQLGISESKIHFFYPLTDDFSCPPKKDRSFTLLFASSPRGPEQECASRFQAKGVNILLEACRTIRMTLLVLWRNDYAQQFKDLAKSLQPTCDIAFVNKHLQSTQDYFAMSSAIVVPYTSLHQSPEYPLSAIQSLACGKPVVCTTIPEFSSIIKKHGCGVNCDPDSDSLGEAIKKVSKMKPNHSLCRETFEHYFLIDEAKIKDLQQVLF